MTEQEWLDSQGFNESSPVAGVVALAVIGMGIFAMKKISDKKRRERGEKKETWKEWLLKK